MEGVAEVTVPIRWGAGNAGCHGCGLEVGPLTTCDVCGEVVCGRCAEYPADKRCAVGLTLDQAEQLLVKRGASRRTLARAGSLVGSFPFLASIPHSCVPAGRLAVTAQATVRYVHADEARDPSVDTIAPSWNLPLQLRAQLLGFSCSCARCEAERDDAEVAIPKVLASFDVPETSPATSVHEARVLVEDGDCDAALSYLISSIRGGEADSAACMGMLAEVVEFGLARGPPCIELYAIAARMGDPFAQYRLGAGLLEDPVKWGVACAGWAGVVGPPAACAKTWLERAAGQGQEDAQLTLGTVLLKGALGVTRHPADALRWLRECTLPEATPLIHQAEQRIREGAEWAGRAEKILKLPAVLPGPRDGSPLPTVSIVTLTHGRLGIVSSITIPNITTTDYPRDKLEWVVVDDSGGEDQQRVQEGIESAGVSHRFVVVPSGTPIAEKRNVGVAKSTGAVIVIMDDDDLYHPQSVAVRVAALEESHRACVGCLSLINVCVEDGTACTTTSPCPAEASLAFRRTFWGDRQFVAHERWGEGWGFLQGQEEEVAAIPSDSVMISLVHGENVTGRARTVHTGQPAVPLSTIPPDYLPRLRPLLPILEIE